MRKEIRDIVDQIKIMVELGRTSSGPITAEVSMGEPSKLYIGRLIQEYGDKRFEEGVNSINEQRNSHDVGSECCTPRGQIKRYKDCVGCDKKPRS